MRISDWSSDVCSSDLLSQQLRAAGLNVETQLEPRKLAKQLQYADRAGIRFVVIRGEDEAARGAVAVKDLRRGEQFERSEERREGKSVSVRVDLGGRGIIKKKK